MNYEPKLTPSDAVIFCLIILLFSLLAYIPFVVIGHLFFAFGGL